MITYIIGAGSMGCLWAAHLDLAQQSLGVTDEAAAQVQFIEPRAKHADKRSYTFQLQSDFLESTTEQQLSFPSSLVAKHESTSPNRYLECVLVCTKSYATPEALQMLSNVISDETLIVLFQNGLGSHYKILELFPNNPIYAAVSTEGANRPSPNIIVHAGKGVTKIGALNHTASNPSSLEKLKAHLIYPSIQSYLAIEFVDDIWQALWTKLIINCAINPYTACSDCINGEVKDTQLFKETWPDLRSELSQLLTLAGYQSDDEEIEAVVLDVMRKTHSNMSSMLQDVRAKRQTEIKDINGFAAEFLRKHNLNNHTNTLLYKKVLALSE